MNPQSQQAQHLLDLVWMQRNSNQALIHFYQDLQVVETWTAADLWRRASAMSELFEQRKLPKAVAISLPNGPDFIAVLFGLWMSRRIAIPLPAPNVMIAEEYRRTLAGIISKSPIEFFIGQARDGKLGLNIPFLMMDELQDQAQIKHELTPLKFSPQPQDICVIQFSSGSTSDPKGILLSHQKILINLQQISQGIQSMPGQQLMSWLPLYHDMGLIGGLLSPLYHQVILHLHSPVDFIKDPLAWLSLVEKKGIHFLVGPDFMYKSLAQLMRRCPQPMNLSSLQFCMTGSEPVSARTCHQFNEVFSPVGLSDRALMPVYGLAEAVLGVSFHPFQTKYETEIFSKTKLAQGFAEKSADERDSIELVSCGYPLLQNQISILNEEQEILEEGRIGEICFWSPALTTGYWQRQDFFQEQMCSYGFRTGDLGFIHRGRIFVSGRKKDLLIVRGKKIFSVDVERVLSEKFSGKFGRIAVVGERDLDLSEDQVFVVIEQRGLWRRTKISRKEIISTLAGWVPLAENDIFFVPTRTIPRTSSGKSKRYLLNEMIQNGEIQRRQSWFFVYFLQAQISKVKMLLRVGKKSTKTLSDEPLADPLRKDLIAIFCLVVGVSENEVSFEKKISEYGLDSIQVVQLIHELEKKTGPIPILDFYRFDHLEQVYVYLKERHSKT